jgi:lycopene cyclase CruA
MTMKEILYLEVPTPDTQRVCTWLQEKFEPGMAEKVITPDGFRLIFLLSNPPTATNC